MSVPERIVILGPLQQGWGTATAAVTGLRDWSGARPRPGGRSSRRRSPASPSRTCHATGIADIARLGIGRGTFYRYFDNKRDIVEHVVDDLIGHHQALGAENAPNAVSARGLPCSADRADRHRPVADLQRRPRMAQLLVSAVGIDDAMRERMPGLFEATTPITGSTSHGVRLGYLRADLDVEATAFAING